MTNPPASRKLLLVRVLYALAACVLAFAVTYALLKRGSAAGIQRVRKPLPLGKESLPAIPPPPGVRDVPVLPQKSRKRGQMYYESKEDWPVIERFYRRSLTESGWRENHVYAKRVAEATQMQALAFARDGRLCVIQGDSNLKPSGTAVIIWFLRMEGARK